MAWKYSCPSLESNGVCDPIIAHCLLESADVVFAYLVAKSAGTAVNLHHDISRVNAQTCSSGLIVDFSDLVHFDEVVSVAQGPELVPPAFRSSVGDKGGIGAGNSAKLLSAIQVFLGRLSLLQHAARTPVQDSVQLRIGKAQMPA